MHLRKLLLLLTPLMLQLMLQRHKPLLLLPPQKPLFQQQRLKQLPLLLQ